MRGSTSIASLVLRAQQRHKPFPTSGIFSTCSNSQPNLNARNAHTMARYQKNRDGCAGMACAVSDDLGCGNGREHRRGSIMEHACFRVDLVLDGLADPAPRACRG